MYTIAGFPHTMSGTYISVSTSQISVPSLIFFIGFIFVDDLLKLRQFQRYSEDDVKRVVADNDKKRFALRNDPATNRLQIRANQGHTMEVSINININIIQAMYFYGT